MAQCGTKRILIQPYDKQTERLVEPEKNLTDERRRHRWNIIDAADSAGDRPGSAGAARHVLE
jgi:hypothetical protein